MPLIAGKFVPEVAINAVIDKTLFNASSFVNRTGIDSVSINVTYSFDTTSISPLLSLNQ